MAATAFITLQEYKSWRDAAGSIVDTSGDDMAELVIGAVCTAMEEYLRRPIVARDLTRYSDGGVKRIFLAHKHPGFLSVTSVVEDGVTLVKDTDYMVYVHEGYLLRISGGAESEWEKGPQKTTVAYKAGVAETVNDVPKDLKLAAIHAIKFHLGLGPEDMARKFADGMSVSTDRWPKQCLWIMDHYRLHTGGGT